MKRLIKDEKDFDEQMQMWENNHNKYNHLTFMFAAPLAIHSTSMGRYYDIDQLDCKGEWDNLYKALSDKKKHIKLRKICGTLSNFQSILQEGTLVLHFSGHGETEEKLKGTQFDEFKN